MTKKFHDRVQIGKVQQNIELIVQKVKSNKTNKDIIELTQFQSQNNKIQTSKYVKD